MKKTYYKIIDKVNEKLCIKNIKERLLAMIYADLIGGLTFVYKSAGIDRVIDSMILIVKTNTDTDIKSFYEERSNKCEDT